MFDHVTHMCELVDLLIFGMGLLAGMAIGVFLVLFFVCEWSN